MILTFNFKSDKRIRSGVIILGTVLKGGDLNQKLRTRLNFIEFAEMNLASQEVTMMAMTTATAISI